MWGIISCAILSPTQRVRHLRDTLWPSREWEPKILPAATNYVHRCENERRKKIQAYRQQLLSSIYKIQLFRFQTNVSLVQMSKMVQNEVHEP